MKKKVIIGLLIVVLISVSYLMFKWKSYYDFVVESNNLACAEIIERSFFIQQLFDNFEEDSVKSSELNQLYLSVRIITDNLYTIEHTILSIEKEQVGRSLYLDSQSNLHNTLLHKFISTADSGIASKDMYLTGDEQQYFSGHKALNVFMNKFFLDNLIDISEYSEHNRVVLSENMTFNRWKLLNEQINEILSIYYSDAFDTEVSNGSFKLSEYLSIDENE